MKQRGGFLWNHNIWYGLIGSGSVIYAIGNPDHFYNSGFSEKPDDDDDGDDYHIHSGASFLELEDPVGRWNNLGGMLNCYRSYPSCASLGDKIFVFGARSSDSPFAEFYDKKNATWQVIPMPGVDHQMQFGRCIISDPNNNRLLVYFSTSLYAYYPDKNHHWDCLDHHMSWTGETASSLIDDVIYFMITNTDYSNCITAYDILTKKQLEVEWSSSSPFGPDILDQLSITELLFLGSNILCFTHTDFFQHPTRAFWEYYRFQVCRVPSQHKVLLTPISLHRLPAPVKRPNSQVNTIPL